MTRWRFVHAADLHLDTPFEGLARLGAEVPAALRDASLQAWDNLVAETIRQEAHALVLAGDIHDGPRRGLRGQLRFRDGLQRLSDHGVQVFLVGGNHDPLEDGWSAIGRWPLHVTAFGAAGVESAPILVDGEEVARVQGISFARRDTTDNLAAAFPREREAPFVIGLLHANAGNNPDHAAYAPCSLEDLRAAAVDYWALGHIHRRQTVLTGDAETGDPWAVYAGVLQGRSPKPAETGAKGAMVVEVDGDRVAEPPRFVPLDVVRFVRDELDCTDIADVPALRDALADLGDAAVRNADGRRVILRATLTGRTPLHAELRRAPDTLDGVLDELNAGGGRTWWDRVTDATRAPLDRDAIRRRGDFAADMLAHADALREDPDALLETLRGWASPADHKTRDVLDRLDADTAREVLDDAEAEALDRLEDE